MLWVIDAKTDLIFNLVLLDIFFCACLVWFGSVELCYESYAALELRDGPTFGSAILNT